ncbi:MAG: c-type cytochrome [Candidatus Delongbacteria bacterium]|nr:c-type cytochrome [Candidatus Delongbacteria bacterium]MBN2834505.1 c-type cytochrome [Candidatus Delongbacteria bacterium]
MNYPVWYIPQTGGAILVAIIAITHVFISHLAVGGGLFLILTERKAVKTKNNKLLNYVKKHTKFFLLLTMVYGGLTGVGIWWIISLVNPAATSTLIHNFVFGWATEWVFFIGEITALLIFYYKFDSINRKDHMILGWLYFIFAWLSLFIINGIIDFMLTPGGWIETGSFWAGFFNETYFPSLFFRSGISFMLAGLFGLVTAIREDDADFRAELIKLNLKWFYLPFLLIIPTAVWYFSAIPEQSSINITNFYNKMNVNFYIMLFTTIIMLVTGLFFLLKRARILHVVSIIILLLTGLSWMGGFEYLREIARKPYVIYDYMYSNSILKSDIERLSKEGFLVNSKWAKVKEVNLDNLLIAGEELYKLQCSSCHTIGGYNDILPKTKELTERGIEAILTGMGKINKLMPPFVGTLEEKSALSAYIARSLHNKAIVEEEEAPIDIEDIEIPEFDTENAKFALFAFNDLGMHCISDNDKYWSFLPPANTLMVQLVKRGSIPEIITEGVKIEFEVQSEYENPSQHLNFWDYSEIVYGAKLEKNIGLAGVGVNGEMHKDPSFKGFSVHAIPITPYRNDKKFNPFPVYTIRAIDEDNGEVLAISKVVAPTSTEVGCRNCHEGGWRWENKAGLADETAKNILIAHDKISGTTLYNDAMNGKPMLCQSCHEDPALKAPGKESILNFSSAVHGFHATVLAGTGVEACNLCHPSNPQGKTSCSRGYHNELGLDCTDCHGNIEDHALSLLSMENMKKKPNAQKLINVITPTKVDNFTKINKRMPWINEPDCLSCHKGYDHLQDDFNPDSFNKWVGGFNDLFRNRTDGMGVMCATCHGAPHADYAGTNKYMENRDNLQPMQYQGIPGVIAKEGNCQICHMKKMDVEGHHINMLRK